MRAYTIWVSVCVVPYSCFFLLFKKTFEILLYIFNKNLEIQAVESNFFYDGG